MTACGLGMHVVTHTLVRLLLMLAPPANVRACMHVLTTNGALAVVVPCDSNAQQQVRLPQHVPGTTLLGRGFMMLGLVV